MIDNMVSPYILISVWPVTEKIDEIGNKPDEYHDEPCKIWGAQAAEEDARLKKINRHPEHTDEREQQDYEEETARFMFEYFPHKFLSLSNTRGVAFCQGVVLMTVQRQNYFGTIAAQLKI
jgi:hypothetical protein